MVTYAKIGLAKSGEFWPLFLFQWDLPEITQQSFLVDGGKTFLYFLKNTYINELLRFVLILGSG